MTTDGGGTVTGGARAAAPWPELASAPRSTAAVQETRREVGEKEERRTGNLTVGSAVGGGGRRRVRDGEGAAAEFGDIGELLQASASLGDGSSGGGGRGGARRLVLGVRGGR